ncbi:hypothetical protein BTR23_12355 [Alkalihalophilus pseudofirmus]|nr:hypothetical protein BTR23_12355 [Alkalihalophilus pseudofirmus]
MESEVRGLSKKIKIFEVGPREGFQIEDGPISTENKINLINRLSETGLKSIEVTSFVSPKWVPQMADADRLLSGINKNHNVAYRTVYLNVKGLQRALLNNVTIDGVLMITASHTFSKKNTNKDINETLKSIPSWIVAYKSFNISVDQLAVMAAFGCNFEGYLEINEVKNVIRQAIQVVEEQGETIKKIKLADTMGWANPYQMKRTIDSIKNEWPHIEIALHLHDTRGLGLANALAAIQEGVYEFESAVGGLGGCPFAAVKGAAGNVATEDLVFMCHEMGFETNIDLDKLLDCARMAEEIVKHPLPGHLLRGGMLKK